MARPLRVDFPGAWHHVIGRGNQRRDIFRGAGDRRHWLKLLGELPARFGVRLHGYVMMPNHYHLVIESGGMALSRVMQWFNLSYTQWFNVRHQRVGPLFQGRYKAVVFEAERWALPLSRYVHLNPVRVKRLGLTKAAMATRRAGLAPAASAEEVAERVRVLRDFSWSSYPAYVGWEKVPAWLSVGRIRSLAAGPRSGTAAAYRRYVEEAIREGIEEDLWERVEGQLWLGGKALKEKVATVLRGAKKREHTGARGFDVRDFQQVVAAVCRIKREQWSEFRDRHGSWGRDLVLWLARRHCGLTLRELGDRVGGLNYASVSVAITRFGARLANDKTLQKAARQAAQMLNEKI